MQYSQIPPRLHPFRNHLGMQRVREIDVAPERLRARTIAAQTDDASLVDFDDVGFQQDQALQTTVSESDVIDRDQHTGIAQLAHRLEQIRRIADDLLLADLHAVPVRRDRLRKRREKMLGRDGNQRGGKQIDVKSRAARNRDRCPNGGAQAVVIDQRQNVFLGADSEEIVGHLEDPVRIPAEELVGHRHFVGHPEDRLLHGAEIFALRQILAKSGLRIVALLGFVALLVFVDHAILAIAFASLQQLMRASQQLVNGWSVATQEHRRDAGGEPQRSGAVLNDHGGDRHARALGNSRRLVSVGVRQQQKELVSADSAISCSATSPTACPKESFTRLKSSMSTSRTRTSIFSRSMRLISRDRACCSPLRFSSSVSGSSSVSFSRLALAICSSLVTRPRSRMTRWRSRA